MSGSPKSLNNQGTREYIKQLNSERFAGHSDWRMPTLEELASLLKKDQRNGLHLDPVFDNKQIRCWTTDQYDPNTVFYAGAWIVNFQRGQIDESQWMVGYPAYKGGGGRRRNSTNYVRAVRSIK